MTVSAERMMGGEIEWRKGMGEARRTGGGKGECVRIGGVR